MMQTARAIAFVVLAATMTSAHAADSDDAIAARVEQVMRESFKGATPEEWKARLAQDEAQALCSRYHNVPPAEASEKIVQAARTSIRYPTDDKLMGDWKEGAKLAAIGTGGHIGKLQPDPPDRKRGGNCYACHALAPQEVAAGNVGPSLTHYGKRHDTSPDSVRFVYDKIYNAQVTFPCSLMPRFGHNGWLSPQEIAHAVAFLLDPESPVNK